MLKILADDVKLARCSIREHGLRRGVSKLLSAESLPTIQFVKYGLCGCVATLVQVAIVAILGLTVLPTFDEFLKRDLTEEIREKNLLIANLWAFPFSNLVAYLTNRAFVFSSGRHSVWLEICLFTLISGISFAVGIFLGPRLIGWFGIPSGVAQASLIVSSALVNFVCRKFLVFLR